jgi:hypothetical protein
MREIKFQVFTTDLEDDEYYGFDDFFSLYEGGCYLVEVISNIFDKLEGEPK